MILQKVQDLNVKHRLVAIDWGARRVGVAVSADDGVFVFARPAIVMKKYDVNDLASKILKLATDEGAGGIVIGLPLRLDGTDSDTTKMVRTFANFLAAKTDLPIAFVDETLSSAAAQDEMGRVNRDDIKRELDSNSARVILENAIEMIKRG